MSAAASRTHDDYGVALFIFGSHSPDFFPLLGRAIALNSVIEYEVRATASRLLDPAVCSVWSASLSQVTKAAKRRLSDSGSTQALAPLGKFIQEADDFADRRAIYAHGLMPSASLESPRQASAWRTKPGAQDLALGDDLEVLRADVRRGSALVERWNHSLLAILNTLPLLQPESSQA